jgi:hypothetical protein
MKQFPEILKNHHDISRFLKYVALGYPFPAQLEGGRKPSLCDENLNSMKDYADECSSAIAHT